MKLSSTRRAALLDVAASLDRVGNKELEKRYGVPNVLTIARSLGTFVREFFRADDGEPLTLDWVAEKGWPKGGDGVVYVTNVLSLHPVASGVGLYATSAGGQHLFLSRVRDRGEFRQILRLFSPVDEDKT